MKKNKKNEHDKMVLLGKDKLNIIEVLISKALIDSYISHDEFVSVKNALKEYNEMKEEIKNPENPVEYNIRLIKADKHIKNGIESLSDSDGRLVQ